MRPRDQERAKQLLSGIGKFERRFFPLPGIADAGKRRVFVEQVFESIHRVEYIQAIKHRGINPMRADPASDLFDPVKAAEYFRRRGDIEEAFWLVFLFVHFGRNSKTGWQLAREVYGGLGSKIWNWKSIRKDPDKFQDWFERSKQEFDGKFGNHRKYESVGAIGMVVDSYLEWVLENKNHRSLIASAVEAVGENKPAELFDYLYSSMNAVVRFGRTARFDYLTMVGKLDLANLEPGSPYLAGATGPTRGARLFFDGNINSRTNVPDLETKIIRFGTEVGLGMQVMEDSLCNWQKAPDRIVRFRG